MKESDISQRVKLVRKAQLMGEMESLKKTSIGGIVLKNFQSLYYEQDKSEDYKEMARRVVLNDLRMQEQQTGNTYPLMRMLCEYKISLN